MKRENSSDVIPQMLSGAVAGLVSRVVSAPLDVIKIRFQLQNSSAPKYDTMNFAVRRIVHEEGLLGLWKGNVPAVYLWVTYSALQFMFYGELKRYGDSVMNMVDVSGSHAVSGAAVNFFSGATSGMIATGLTYPLDIMRTQFALQGEEKIHTSMASYVQHTYSKHRLPGFFHGLQPAIAGIVPFMGLNFAIYEFLKAKGQSYYTTSNASKTQCSPPHGISLATICGMAGGIAGGVSKLIVYPFDTMKKRMQAKVIIDTFQNKGGQSKTFRNYTGRPFSNLADCFLTILHKEGFLSFYKGLAPTVAKSFVSTAATFFAYEGCLNILKPIFSG